MVLTRKIRKADASIAVTIPDDFAKAMGLEVGSAMEIAPLDARTRALRKRKS